MLDISLQIIDAIFEIQSIMINDFQFDITVIPKSTKSDIITDQYDKIRIYLNSIPAYGKANAELVKLLSKELKISKSKIKIVMGKTSRKKRISVEGLKKEEVLKILKNR